MSEKKYLSLDGLSTFLAYIRNSFSDKDHTHNDIYYTESEIDSKLSGKANTSHTHSISNISGLQGELDSLEASIGSIEDNNTTYDLAASKSSSNGNVKLNLTAGGSGSGMDSVSVKGSGATTVTTDSTGVVTINSTNTTYSNATQLDNGLMSSADKTKLDNIASGAQVNQNAFSNVKVGDTTIAADTKTDTLTLDGSNVTLTPDADNDKVTIGVTKANVVSALGYTPPTTNTTYSNATQSTSGLMSSTDKTKLDNIDSNAEVNQNAFSNVSVNGSTIAADSKTDTITLAGSNVTLTPDTSGDKVTIGITKANVTSALGYTPPTTNTTYGVATQSANGLMSASDKIKLDGVAAHAEVNQNAFSNIIVGDETISADSKTDSLTLAAGSNVTLSANGDTDSITINAVDTKYNNATTSTAGLMSASDKSKLDGIATGANKYILPVAGSAIGGVKSGTDISVDSSGNVSVNNDSHTHSASTIKSVNASAIVGTISAANLPGYVDDVVEYSEKADFPGTGESGKIYIDASTNKTYRWSGSSYVEISASIALGETASTAYRGDRGAAAYKHAVTNKGSAFSSGLYKLTPNSEGHVTAATAVSKGDITALGIPSSDTHYTSKNVVGTPASTSNTTSALANGSVYINSVENGAVTSSHKISGSGATKVTTDTSGNIVISSTDNNTVYTHPTTSGYKHIPAGGASGQILRWSADGTAAWGADNNTDTKVTQTVTTANAVYPLLLAPSGQTGTTTTTTYFDSGVTLNPSSNTITSNISGNATTATQLQTARTINGTSFNGTGNITTNLWGTARNITIADSSSAHSGTATSVNGSGNVTLHLPSTISGSLAGNATTATTLQTARTINGTSFNGSASITTASWGTARTLTIGNTGKSVNGSGNVSWTRNEIGAANGWESSGTTAATAGWYRIATSAASIVNCTGTFYVIGAYSGYHTAVTLDASISYGISSGVSLIQRNCSSYSSPSLTKARIVYHTTYSNNYAYLEVYMSHSVATSISVKFIGSGWNSVTPSTAGSIPSGYSNKEITLYNGSNYMVGNLSGYATSAGTATKLGTTTIGGTAKPIYLNAGTATACSATVGSSTHPVYMNAGTITASSSTVGSSTKPMYLNAGTMTASSSTVGGAARPMYLNAGTMTACSSTVGSSTVPVYMNGGTITKCGGTLGVNITGSSYKSNTLTPITTGGTQPNYTASVSGITSLTAGVNFVMKPHASAEPDPDGGIITLNVNSLGAKTVRRKVSGSTSTVNAKAADIQSGKPVLMTYDGTYWIISDDPKPSASDLNGNLSARNVTLEDGTNMQNAWDSISPTKIATTNSYVTPRVDRIGDLVVIHIGQNLNRTLSGYTVISNNIPKTVDGLWFCAPICQQDRADNRAVISACGTTLAIEPKGANVSGWIFCELVYRAA